MQTRRLSIIALAAAGILLIPFIAMQFTDQVQWTLSDFVIAGVLLFGTGLLANWAWSKIGNPTYRIAAVVAIAAVLLLVWAELAVGVFGSPIAGN